MADEIIAPAVVDSPAPVAVVAPVVTATESPDAETKVEAPTAEAVAPVAESTLLTGEKIALEAKAEEKTPEAEVAPVEVKEGEPAPLPVYEAFTLPEEVKFDEAKLGDFTKSLAEFEVKSKASHEEVQALGQQLIDRHIEGVKEAQNLLLEKLIADGKAEREQWKDSFMKSPEFSNRTDTVVNAAIDAISIYGGNADQQKEFRDLMMTTGVGNHPAMIRMLSNMMIAKPEPKPLAAPKIAKAAPMSKMEKRYGAKS